MTGPHTCIWAPNYCLCSLSVVLLFLAHQHKTADIGYWRSKNINSFDGVLLGGCQTPSKTEIWQSDRHQESYLVRFSLKMWHLVAIILIISLIINWPNFVYFLVDPGFLSPLKFLWNIALRSPYRIDAPNKHNGQRDKRTCLFIGLFVCILDGVWHWVKYFGRRP